MFKQTKPAMRSQSVRSPSELLGEGVAMLQAPNCVAEAIRTLNCALANLKDFINAQSSTRSREICHQPPLVPYIQVEVPFPTNDKLYVHQYAILFEADALTLLQDGYSLDFMCAVTAYNLALAFHSWGVRESNHKMLHHALIFYRTCLGVVGRNQSCSPSFAFLALAALNNQSCICFEFEDMETYGEIQRKLPCHLFTMLHTSATTKLQPCSLYVSHFVFFFFFTQKKYGPSHVNSGGSGQTIYSNLKLSTSSF
jgi:hypothetical protein